MHSLYLSGITMGQPAFNFSNNALFGANGGSSGLSLVSGGKSSGIFSPVLALYTNPTAFNFNSPAFTNDKYLSSNDALLEQLINLSRVGDVAKTSQGSVLWEPFSYADYLVDNHSSTDRAKFTTDFVKTLESPIFKAYLDMYGLGNKHRPILLAGESDLPKEALAAQVNASFCLEDMCNMYHLVIMPDNYESKLQNYQNILRNEVGVDIPLSSIKLYVHMHELQHVLQSDYMKSNACRAELDNEGRMSSFLKRAKNNPYLDQGTLSDIAFLSRVHENLYERACGNENYMVGNVNNIAMLYGTIHDNDGCSLHYLDKKRGKGNGKGVPIKRKTDKNPKQVTPKTQPKTPTRRIPIPREQSYTFVTNPGYFTPGNDNFSSDYLASGPQTHGSPFMYITGNVVYNNAKGSGSKPYGTGAGQGRGQKENKPQKSKRTKPAKK